MRWWRHREQEQDLDRELRADLELEAAEQRESGPSEEEAGCAARPAFGNPTLVGETVRETWGWAAIERLVQDVRFSLRTPSKTPGFVVFAALAPALGPGANAAIFSVVDAVLLRPLPFRHADRLAEVWADASLMGFQMATPAPGRRNSLWAVR